MRRFTLILLFIFIACAALPQRLSLDELLNLTMLSSKKTERFLSKKGFSRQFVATPTNKIVYNFQPKKKSKRKKDMGVLSSVEKFQDGRIHTLIFQTSSDRDYELLKRNLEKEGFNCNDNTGNGMSFRKGNTMVLFDTLSQDSDTLYSLRITKKELPLLSRIKFANDLLQFNSHSDLLAVFGESNLKKDLYYFTEKEIKSCSVLFPRSSRQAVFIWEDDSSSTGLNSVVIGGSLRIASDMNYTSKVAENSWVLANGLRSNLSLRELIRMNGSDVRIYGRQSRYFLSLVPQNTGAMDLHNLSVVLGCLNCAGSSVLNASTVSAELALSHGLGMFVMMIMLLPEE